MTLLEMRNRARDQAGLMEGGEDANRLTDDYLNEGLTELCGGRFAREAELALQGGGAPIGAVDGLLKVDALVDGQGREVPFEIRRGWIYALDGRRDGPVTLHYSGRPPLMREVGDLPDLPLEFHGALADYATWRLLSGGGQAQQSRAQAYLARFHMAGAAAERYFDAQLGGARLRNKY